MSDIEKWIGQILEETVKFNQLSVDQKIAYWKSADTIIPPSFPLGGGKQLFTNRAAVLAFNRLAKLLHNESKETKSRISLETIRSKAQAAVGEMISELKKLPDDKREENLVLQAVKIFRTIIKRDLDASLLTQTRVVPCHVFSESDVEPFLIGPVAFSPRLNWVKNLQPSEKWTEYVVDVWEGRLSKQELEKLAWKRRSANKSAEAAHSVVTAFENRGWCSSLISTGYDNQRSQYRAEILTELALGILGLVMDPSDAANLVFAGGERVPFRRARIGFDRNGKLFSGSSINFPGVSASKKSIEEFRSRQRSYMTLAGQILQTYAGGPTQKDRPRLVERWINAIHWHSQAVKEQADYMALVKYGCVLDIISGAGGDIARMSEFVGAVFGADANKKMPPNNVSLREVVTDIYHKGRSSLAHGSEFGLLEDLRDARMQAHKTSRELLLDTTIPLAELIQKSSQILKLDKNETKAFMKYLRDRSGGT